jgi:hypothetical protein
MTGLGEGGRWESRVSAWSMFVMDFLSLLAKGPLEKNEERNAEIGHFQRSLPVKEYGVPE